MTVRHLVLLSMLTCLPAQEKAATQGKIDAPSTAEERSASGQPTKPAIAPKSTAPGAEVGKLPGAASGLTAFDTSCDPAVLAPGEAGTLVVVMKLRGDAVMLDPPPVEFSFGSRQGALSIDGEPTFRPTRQKGLAPAMKGTPVYDDVAIIDVPITVSPGATEGTHRIELALQYELWNGVKGGSYGKLKDLVSGEVRVGRARSDAGQSEGPGTQTAIARAAPVVESATTPERREATIQDVGAAKAIPGSGDGAPPPTAEGEPPYLLFAVGAAVLALTALIALRIRSTRG